ncbi:MAG: GFA family protein [Sphingomonadales bacterium]
MEGGCQCGRIRYTADIVSDDAYLCHCRMCQRATGGVSIAFVNLPKVARTWQTEPDWYASSPIARRPFCSACGTPLGFEFIDGPNCDLTVGSFDQPSRFVPTSHFGVESRHDAWLETADLPATRCGEHRALVERWKNVGLSVPD